MQELIKVTQNEQGSQLVSARDLYEFLEVKTEFNKWCTRMFEYGFENEKDYTEVSVKNDDNSKGGRNTLIDYVLTLDTSKEIAMLQRSDKGKQARSYFIECEKQLKAPKELSRKELALMIVQAEEEKEILLLKIAEDKPKLEFAEQLLSTTNALDFSSAAKSMNLGFGNITLFKHCRNLSILRSNNEPYQQNINNGYFILLESSFLHPKSGDRVLTTKTMITAKGQQWLLKVLKKNNIIK